MLYGVKIGQVISRRLDENGISFVAAINPEHRQLVHADSKFIVNSRLDVKFGLDGMQVLGASAREWVDGGIRLVPGAKGQPSSRYPLYAELRARGGRHYRRSAADHAQTDRQQPAGCAGRLGGAVPQVPEVGEVVDVVPRADAFEISVHIQPQYRKLLTSESVFWAEGGAKVQLNGSGLTVQGFAAEPRAERRNQL